MDKAQSETIHIGNIGEHLIGSILSPYCIVRNVSQGRDTGIDLYCEIIKKENLELSLHFFCQVKTKKSSLNMSESKQYFNYWGNQPVPVFLFHVRYKDTETINKEYEIWIHDIPYLLALSDAKRLIGKHIHRDVDSKFQICERDNNKNKMTLETFLYGHVPWSYGLWQMRRYGLVFPNPEIKVHEKNIFVGGFSKIYEDKINKSIEYARWLQNIEKDDK